MSDEKNSRYIAKAPQLIITRILNERKTQVLFPTISVKERGQKWSDARTFRCFEGLGESEIEAKRNLYTKWEEFCQDQFNESIFIETINKTPLHLTQGQIAQHAE